MLDFLLGLIVRLTILIFGIWLFFKARSWAKKVRTMPLVWSRRFALLFLFAPVLAFVGGWLFAPPLGSVFEALGAIGRGLDAAVRALVGEADGSLGWWWGMCLQPLLTAVVYGAAGFLVGWPFDLMAARSKSQESEEAPAAEA